ncbi:MAG: DUF1365 domain-containing protein, partial [Pseudomonadota bacterium]
HTYETAYLCFDVSLLDEHDHQQCNPHLAINRFGVLGIHRNDLIEPTSMSIRDAVKHTLNEHGHTLPTDATIRVLTLPRFFGYTFNPVSFYTITHKNDTLYAMLSDITNTPWGERHTYVHMASEANSSDASFVGFTHDKTFHVSPFMPMELEYQWAFSHAPLSQTIRIHIYEKHHATHSDHALASDFDSHRTPESKQLKFNAAFKLNKMPFSHQTKWKTVMLFAFLPIKVIVRIYWHALLLWIKRVPFFKHPKHTHHVITYRERKEDT